MVMKLKLVEQRNQPHSLMTETENTPEQIAAHEANERRAAEEAKWPIFKVDLLGDDAEWEARPNPDYWMDDGEKWVPKDADDLPEGASIHPDSGKVVMPATATVTLHARNEEHAKMLALKVEEDAGYHTVTNVVELNT